MSYSTKGSVIDFLWLGTSIDGEKPPMGQGRRPYGARHEVCKALQR